MLRGRVFKDLQLGGERIKVLACESLMEELISLRPNAKMEFLDYSLHDTPEQLTEELKLRIQQETESDTILLGYGLCSNGVVGLSSERHRLVVPKVHDCIALLIGSVGKFASEFTKSPDTFYLSKGWIDYGRNPMKEFFQFAKHYGEDDAKWIINEMYKNYHKIAMIDTGVCEAHYFEYARRVADFMQWNYEEIIGSAELLQKLVTGQWDEDFLVIEPGKTIEQESFLCIGCCNQAPGS